MKRRTFLVASATAAGGFVLGYRAWVNSFAAHAATLVETGDGRLLAGWVKISPDDVVTVYVPHVDMGQGSQTGLAMMLAEELDAASARTANRPSGRRCSSTARSRAWTRSTSRMRFRTSRSDPWRTRATSASAPGAA